MKHFDCKSKSAIMRELFAASREQGKSRYEVARLVGYSNTSVTYWFMGQRMPSVLAVARLAEVLGYDLILRKKHDPKKWAGGKL